MARTRTRYTSFEIPELRGLDENENPHELPVQSLSSAINVWRLGRSIGTRPGTILDPDDDYENALSGAVVGVVDFRRTRDSARTLVVVVPGAIQTDDGAALTLGAGVVVTNAAVLPWCFVQHKNILYAAGGDVGTSDTAWYWDPAGGTTAARLGILNNASSNIEPRYLCEFANRLFAAGFSGSDPSGNPGIVRYSALNDGATWPIENTIGGNFSVGGFAADSDEFVTGLATLGTAENRWLVIQTNRRLYPVLEDLNPLAPFRIGREISIGCASHLLYVNPGVGAGDAVYVSDDGIHSVRQTQEFGPYVDRFISWKIRKTFASINRSRLKYGVSGYWRAHGIAVFALSTGSNTTNDTLLMLDMKDSGDHLSPEAAMWFPWKMIGTNHNLSYLTAGRTEDGVPALFWGDYGGRVGVFTADSYDDLGAAYTSGFRTKYTDFNASTATKTLGDFSVDIGGPTSGSTYDVALQPLFDFGHVPGEIFPISFDASGQFQLDVSILDVDSLGEEESIMHHKLYGTGSGYTVAFDITNTGVDEPFYIHRIAGEVAVAGEHSEEE